VSQQERSAKHYRAHKAEINKRHAKHYLEHREERLEQMAQYHRDNIERRNKACRDRYAANKVQYGKTVAAYRIAHPKRYAFQQQRTKARRRGIEFLLTLEAWIAWWGSDFEFRGTAYDSLQMCRFDDEGPYRIGNIYKASKSENSSGPRPLPVPSW